MISEKRVGKGLCDGNFPKNGSLTRHFDAKLHHTNKVTAAVALVEVLARLGVEVGLKIFFAASI